MSLSKGYRFSKIELAKIILGEANARGHSDAKIGLDKLKDSIKEVGLLQPIVVVEIGHNSFELVVGQRRYLAVKELSEGGVPGFSRIDAKVFAKDTDITQLRIASATENLQRRELSDADKQKSTTFLLKQLGNLGDVALSLGYPIHMVSAWLDYDSIVPKSIKRYVDDDRISREYAKQIVGSTYPDLDKAEEMISELIRRGFAKNAAIRQKLLVEARKEKAMPAEKIVLKAAARAREVRVDFVLADYYGDSIKKVAEERTGKANKQSVGDTAQSIVQDWIDTRLGKK